MSLQIVGAALGRTGTNSLKLALEQLGFGPCHHMYEVRDHPEQLPSEQQLEEMIVAAPEMLSDEWILIGRQENTGFGGRIDLLAITPTVSRAAS